MPSELLKDSGLILRCFNAKESDCVIHCLTKSHGKLHLFARHARKSKRRFAGGLDPLSLGDLEFKNASGSLQFLEHFQTLESAHRYISPFQLYQAACLWVECIDLLCPEGHFQEGLYELAQNTLAELSTAEAREEFERIIRTAIKKALVQGGFLPEEQEVLEFKHALQLVEETAQKELKSKW